MQANISPHPNHKPNFDHVTSSSRHMAIAISLLTLVQIAQATCLAVCTGAVRGEEGEATLSVIGLRRPTAPPLLSALEIRKGFDPLRISKADSTRQAQ